MAKFLDGSNNGLGYLWNRIKTLINDKTSNFMNKDLSNSAYSLSTNKTANITINYSNLDGVYGDTGKSFVPSNDFIFDDTAVNFTKDSPYTGLANYAMTPSKIVIDNKPKFGFKWPYTVGATATQIYTRYVGKIGLFLKYSSLNNEKYLDTDFEDGFRMFGFDNINKKLSNYYFYKTGVGGIQYNKVNGPNIINNELIVNSVLAGCYDSINNKYYYIPRPSSVTDRPTLHKYDFDTDTEIEFSLNWPSSMYRVDYESYLSSRLVIYNNVLYWALDYVGSSSTDKKCLLYKATLPTSTTITWTAVTLPTMTYNSVTYTIQYISFIVIHKNAVYICFNGSNNGSRWFIYSYNGSAFTLKHSTSIPSRGAITTLYTEVVSCNGYLFWTYLYNSSSSQYKDGYLNWYDDTVAASDNPITAYMVDYKYYSSSDNPNLGNLFVLNDNLYGNNLGFSDSYSSGIWKFDLSEMSSSTIRVTRSKIYNGYDNYQQYAVDKPIFIPYGSKDYAKDVFGFENGIVCSDWVTDSDILYYLSKTLTGSTGKYSKINNSAIWINNDIKLTNPNYAPFGDAATAGEYDVLDPNQNEVYVSSRVTNLLDDKYVNIYKNKVFNDNSLSYICFIEIDLEVFFRVARAVNNTIYPFTNRNLYFMYFGENIANFAISNRIINPSSNSKNYENLYIYSAGSSSPSSGKISIGSRKPTHDKSYIFGFGNKSTATNQVILGSYADPKENDAFVVGNGDRYGNESNLFRVDKSGTFFINGDVVWAQGRLKNTLLQGSPYWYELEDGACYWIELYGKVISNNTFRGWHSYIIRVPWYTKDDVGAASTASDAGRANWVGLGAVGTVAFYCVFVCKPYVYTNEGTGTTYTRYKNILGIGCCVTNIDLRFKIVKVMGSVEDF